MDPSRWSVSPEEVPRELCRLREAIDRVDEVLVRLLNQRARYAIEIGRIKGIVDMPVYSPEREQQVLANVERHSEGPLDAATMRRLFERIIDESRRVERVEASSLHAAQRHAGSASVTEGGRS